MGGKKCRNKAIPGIQYCAAHLKQLEATAMKNMRHNTVGFIGKDYFEKLVVFLFGAAGTQSGELLVKHWESIWAKIHLIVMRPPGLVGEVDGREIFIGRMHRDGSGFVDSFLAPIAPTEVVERFLQLAGKEDPKKR
jgi:hypothetical protein